MVTENTITALFYNEEKNSTFENSYADQWLNQEFLPTLHDYQDYLVVDSLWNATQDSLETPNRPAETTIVKRTVGLLNAYEYSKAQGYLFNGIGWFDLLTPYDVESIWSVSHYGSHSSSRSAHGGSLRPSIYLKPEIQMESGTGEMGNPYRLVGDQKEEVTYINERYSGEYLQFNGEKYRIMGVEGGKTKIIAENPISGNGRFDSTSSDFSTSEIKQELEDYYQHLDSRWKSMIAPNQTWYLASIQEGESYKNTICKNSDVKQDTRACEKTDVSTTANIALPRIGEMFITQNVRSDSRLNLWLLTPLDTNNIWDINHSNFLSSTKVSERFGQSAKVSFYLKENVRISPMNVGDGTYERPYTIELTRKISSKSGCKTFWFIVYFY